MERGKRKEGRGKWKAVLYAFLFPLFLYSCVEKGNHFHLEGRFKNINQGELYLCDLDQGHKDTILLNGGRFTYDIDLSDTIILTLVFPNFSELPIIAEPGSRVDIEGDVSHLKETEISGTDDNELMTGFRLQTKELMPPTVKEKAEAFILEHPESPASLYLLRRYFIMSVDADYARVQELCEKMQKARPWSIPLLQLYQRLSSVGQCGGMGKLPHFTAIDVKGDTITNSTLCKQANVIMVWSSWSYDSQNTLQKLNKWRKERHDSIGVISICLDASASEGKKTIERDSILCPNICDGLIWDSPLVSALGIAFIPDNIVVDKKGNIVGRTLNAKDLKDKIDSLF